ncbi:BPTD_2524 family lipoprotein [Achromobacter aloeverae]|uniref:Lipoprotein n=1 Tax=Achromobacter aloeverae TaxID=1750518 RepID=A0A4Q1HSL4_9BURK|nr:hypothetical protein [Achromobacter aloeverae]RXN92935.1 hypothetical protein C7R54_04145 [Achromobacter aloeverae]
MSVFRPLLASALVLLGGCAAEGITPEGNFPTSTFPVQVDYQAAARRTAEFVRVCHTDVVYAYGVNYLSNVTYDERTATGTFTVFNRTEPAKLLEVIKVRPDGPVNTARYAKVTVTVFGEDPWDQQEMEAARQSIQSATPSCRKGPGSEALPLQKRRAPELQGVPLPDAGN